MANFRREMNQNMLAGKEPYVAARDAKRETGVVKHLGSLVPTSLKATNLLEENRINFDRVELEELDPYRVIRDTMLTATKTEPYTEIVIDEEDVYIKDPVSGEQVYSHTAQKPRRVTSYRDTPDHAVRMRAAEKWFVLTGRDPRNMNNITVTANGGMINLGDVYAQINGMATEAEQLASYNRMKQDEQQGAIAALHATKAEGDDEDVIDIDFEFDD